ncbi:hypothetical protein FAGKG844_150021 [Frankia sp. AgKG'84/4]
MWWDRHRADQFLAWPDGVVARILRSTLEIRVTAGPLEVAEAPGNADIRRCILIPGVIA